MPEPCVHFFQKALESRREQQLYLLKTGNRTANINKKNCSLYTLLTATDRKQQNYNRAILTTITFTFKQCYCGNIALLMIFAVFDLPPLTVCINGSFFYIYSVINCLSLYDLFERSSYINSYLFSPNVSYFSIHD